MLGVAAMLPLMLLVTGSTDNVAIVTLSQLVGTRDLQDLLIIVSGLVAGSFVTKAVLQLSFKWWLSGHTSRLEAEASTELFRRYVDADYSDHRERNMSEIHRNIGQSIGQAFNGVLLGLISLLTDGLTIILILIVLCIVSPWTTLGVILIFGSVMLGMQTLLRKRQQRVGEEIAEHQVAAWNAVLPGINGFRESRVTKTSAEFVERFFGARSGQAQAGRRMSILSEFPRYVLEIVFVVGVGSLSVLLFTTQDQGQALSILGVFVAAATRLLPTLNRFAGTVGSVRMSNAGLQIVVAELDKLDSSKQVDLSSETPLEKHQDIQVNDVWYRFEDSEEFVVSGVSLTIRAGSTVAFVGSSGAGKSTLLDILLGLFHPTKGEVLYGKVNIHDSLGPWYGTVAIVSQDIFILDDTLAANVAYGTPTGQIDMARVREVVSLAQLDEAVSQLPEGLETRLGERGVRLSGGQRQRVGIARALYRDPDVLILDEATSALDNITEYQISETMKSLSGERTIIIVAHRLSTVKNADEIFFMKNGRIAGSGKFEDLQKSNSDFAELVRIGSTKSN
ncbi:ABC-type multidrug transport system fused ATPase/permease subunit [Neomicrococcus aestuarii]|uniref:ABC-type multidrug transport system fused ATPase/permease subunit n=1 Tax=Neomicrococcus aestuarii TaxID=556325 RepID=A0A7W8TRC8_9MICC|nr:ABC transporter ATP-binding protein [Neomicrococcus aestuarii]MBB5511470.1 ABC-type multidrug transport system fused ATPase/permease subunit [Neomicrococcus aestuarii]